MVTKSKIENFGSMEADGRTSPYTRVKGVLTPVKAPMKAPVKAAPKKKAIFSPVKFKNAQKKVFGMK